ncbi:MAG: alpha/beta hydrolase [Trueperaceae bacterium]
MKESRNSFRRWIGPAAAIGAGLAAFYMVARTRRKAAEVRESHFEPNWELDERSEVVDGVRMHWLEHGHGTPIVLIHGIPTSPLLWRKVMPRLRHAKVYAWEMVGYGGSSGEGEGRDISVAKQADYLAAWLRHMGIGTVVLAGHDLGGGVVQIVAARHPALCSGLFLVDAICYDSWPIPTVTAVRAMRMVVERMPAVVIRPMLELLLRRGHGNRKVMRESAALHLRNYREPGAGRALARQVGSLDVRDTLDVQERLPHLRIPTRVVWGALDPFQKPRYGERLAHDLGTRVVWISGGRHFIPEDRPSEVADALNDLLREVEAEAARDIGASA